MTEKKRQPESEGKDADGAARSDSLLPTPMDRFKSLARRLANVPKADVQKELDKYELAKSKRQRKR